MLQTWAAPAHGRSYPSFDIKARLGRWEGAKFIEEFGRAADLYVFAYHDVSDETADHRNPLQWQFYVVPTSALPAGNRIGLPVLRKLAHPADVAGLREVIANISRQTSERA